MRVRTPGDVQRICAEEGLDACRPNASFAHGLAAPAAPASPRPRSQVRFMTGLTEYVVLGILIFAAIVLAILGRR